MTTDTTAARDQRAREVWTRIGGASLLNGEAPSVEVIYRAMLAFADEAASQPVERGDQAGMLEALTPSASTKAAYIGEFGFNIVDRDEEGDEIHRRVLVPWETTKEIMAAILARAALPSSPAIQPVEGLTIGEEGEFAGMTAGEAIAATAGNDTLMRDLSFAYVTVAKRMPAVAAVIDRARNALATAATPAIRQDEPEGAGVAIPDGWALVPIEPTPEMVAAYDAYWATDEEDTGRIFWSAMLAASPRPAATDQAGEVAYEVWEDDMIVASSTDEADARHYHAVYSQDGPVSLQRAVTTRTMLIAAQPTDDRGAGEVERG